MFPKARNLIKHGIIRPGLEKDLRIPGAMVSSGVNEIIGVKVLTFHLPQVTWSLVVESLLLETENPGICIRTPQKNREIIIPVLRNLSKAKGIYQEKLAESKPTDQTGPFLGMVTLQPYCSYSLLTG